MTPDDAGVASALVNTTQQVGGSLGTALLNTIAAAATAGYLRTHTDALDLAAVHGYQRAFLAGAILLGVGAVASAVLLRSKRP